MNIKDGMSISFRESTRDDATGCAPDWTDYGGDENGWKPGTIRVVGGIMGIPESVTQLEFMMRDCQKTNEGMSVCVENYRFDIRLPA